MGRRVVSLRVSEEGWSRAGVEAGRVGVSRSEWLRQQLVAGLERNTGEGLAGAERNTFGGERNTGEGGNVIRSHGVEDCAASLLGDGVKTVDRWAEQQGMSVPVAIEVLVTMGLAADGYRTPAESAAGPVGTWSVPRRGAWDQDRHGWPLHTVHSITGQRRDAGFEACEDHA